jgi:L-rhamnose mutarotase
MIRHAFTLRLKPGALEEYVERHDAIWPEMVAEIERCGIKAMTAFHGDGTIFYFTEVNAPDSWQRLFAAPCTTAGSRTSSR